MKLSPNFFVNKKAVSRLIHKYNVTRRKYEKRKCLFILIFCFLLLKYKLICHQLYYCVT